MAGQLLITLQQVAEIRRLLGDADPELLHDALEGQTDVFEIIDWLLAKLGDEEAMREAIGKRVNDLLSRNDASGKRIDRLRAALAECLTATGDKTLRRPEATVTLGYRKPAIAHIDATILPDRFFSTVRSVSRSAIRDALAAGEVVSGVTLDNGAPSLTVRRR